MASGINRDNNNASLYGLQYLCNSNTFNSTCDFYITSRGLSYPTGIRTIQGNALLPTGNSFSQIGQNYSHINNYTSLVLSYYYNSNQAIQQPVYFNASVNPIGISISEQCPSHITGSEPFRLLTATETTNFNNEYDSVENTYLSLLYVYNQLMDGGNTNALLNQIQQSWSNNAMILRNELLSRSPYLTRFAIMEAAMQNILSPPVLLEVCMANSDATRDEDLLKFLQYEIVNPLPTYMIEMIRASWESSTTRTTMENAISGSSGRMAAISDNILNDLYLREELQGDTLATLDSCETIALKIYWLNRIQTIAAKYDLALIYFDLNNYEAAESLLNVVHSEFKFSDDQLADFNDFETYYYLLKHYKLNGYELSSLSHSQIDEWSNFATSGASNGRVRASNMLCFYYGLCAEEDYDLQSNGNRLYNEFKSPIVSEVNNISVTPNPVASEAKFGYSIASFIQNKSVLIIADITGKIIEKIYLENQEGKIKWSAENVKNGIYFYYLQNGDEKYAKGKLIVTH